MRLYAAKLSPVGPGKGQDSGLIAAGGTAVLPCVRTLVSHRRVFGRVARETRMGNDRRRPLSPQTYDGRPMHNIVVPSAVHAVCFDDVPGPVQQIAIVSGLAMVLTCRARRDSLLMFCCSPLRRHVPNTCAWPRCHGCERAGGVCLCACLRC